MTRRRLVLLFLPAFLILALAAVMAWLLQSESGARWAWSQAAKLAPGQLTASEVSGDFDSGLRFRGLTYARNATLIKVDEVRLQVAFDVFPPAVDIKSLRSGLLTIRSGPADVESDAAESLAALALPVPIRFDSVEIDRIELQDAAGAAQFSLDALRLSGRWGDRLSLRHAEMRLQDIPWQLNGRIDFRPPFLVDLEVNSRDLSARAADPASSSPPFKLQAQFSGDLTELEARVELDQPPAELRGRIRDLLGKPQLDLQLSAAELTWPLQSGAPLATMQDLAAVVTGSWAEFELSASGELEVPDLPPASVQLTGRGNPAGLRIQQMIAESEMARLQTTGDLEWSNEFSMHLNTTIERFDPRAWIEAWPKEHPLQGLLDLRLTGTGLQFDRIGLTAAGTEMSVMGEGLLDLDRNRVEATLAWEQLRWPLAGGDVAFQSDRGRVLLQGRPEDWTVAGEFQLATGEFPGGQLRLNGNGGKESARVQIEQGEVLGGSFQGRLDYRWTGRQPWSAGIEARQLDISTLTPAYPGVIDASLELQGESAPLRLEIDIHALSGVIRQHPVTAKGALSFDAGQVRAHQLEIRSGESYAQIDGNIQDPEGIRFSGYIESLADFVDETGGTLRGSGRISSQAGNPQVELDLEGNSLIWGDLRIDSALARPLGELDAGTGLELKLTGVEMGGQAFEEISVVAGGETPFEEILIEAHSPATSFDARLAGSIRHWNDFSRLGWQGEIESVRVSMGEMSYLELKEATPLELSSRVLQAGPACFTGARKGVSCIDVNWQDAETLAINASLDAVSLNILQLFLGVDLDFTQTLSGELRWESHPDAQPQADISIVLSPGEVSEAGEETLLRTGDGLLGFRIEDGKLLAGDLDLLLPDAGLINIDFSAPDISRGIESPIEGRIQVTLSQIEPLTQWFTPFGRIAGSLNADARLAGNLAKPKLTGHASLVRGTIEHHASGVTLEDIKLAGAVYEFDYTEFNGSFRSDDGRGQIKAAVDFGNLLKPVVTMELTGQKLTLINVPDMTVTANPDLRFRYQEGNLQLAGSLLIPTARISPSYLPATIAAESEDLVIVAGEQPEAEERTIDTSRLRLNGSVTVELGDDITVSFERATAQLRGKAEFAWDNSLVPIADGTYTVSGKITAYGQLLEVADGRVSFPHVPADNPHLRISAEREIYGNVQIKRAGVLISGTLKNPVMETYTVPVTSQERALTLLVTGSDFDYDQGVGGVEVGMYIAPKLYISYGIGLFDNQSVISARYDLKRGFGIKATSGQKETGADLSYTIER